MAPIIPIRAEETPKAVENVLKRRTDANQILKEREKKILSGKDYWLIEVDLNRSSTYRRWTLMILRPTFTALDRNSSGMFTRFGSGWFG